MKKITVIAVLFALVLTLLSGCFGIPKNLIPQAAKPSAGQNEPEPPQNTTEPQFSAEPDEPAGPGELKKPTNPSEGFTNYSTYKNSAYERVTAASEKSEALSMAVGLGYLGIAMVDLSLIPLTLLIGDPAAAEVAAAMLFNNAKITGAGNDYTITYNDNDGAEVKQTCKYDPAKDQMTSTMYGGDGELSIFFEYVYLGDAYAAQYYYPSGDGYEIIRAYFDKDNVAAFGIVSAADEPSSIIGKSGFNEEFVKNDESYLIFKDGNLTVFDEGTETTN